MANTSKTNQAKQLLVRWMHEHHLQVGDRLPSQGTFRQEFGFGTATITAAVNELKQEGILEVRDKVGAYVRDPGLNGHTTYTIGLVSRYSDHNFFYSSLITTIQRQLSQSNILTRLFVMPEEKFDARSHLDLDDFPGLRRHIAEGTLNAIIHMDELNDESLDFLHRHKIPEIFLGTTGCTNPNGVLLDQPGTLKTICQRISPQPPRRPMLVCHPTISDKCRPVMEQFFPGIYELQTCNGCAEGILFARKFLSIPPKERPDWLIFQDDLVASAICAELVKFLPQEELPNIVIMTQLRHMLFLPLRNVIFYECDMSEYIASCISLMQKALQEKNLAPGRIIHTYKTNTLSEPCLPIN